MQFASKNILEMESLSVDEINMVLDTADSMKEISERPAQKVPTLTPHPTQSLLYLVAGGLRDADAD